MYVFFCLSFFLFFKQKTAYEMRISDWSSDVCSSDLLHPLCRAHRTPSLVTLAAVAPCWTRRTLRIIGAERGLGDLAVHSIRRLLVRARASVCAPAKLWLVLVAAPRCGRRIRRLPRRRHRVGRDRFALYIPHRWQTAMSDMSERWTF